MQSTRRELLRSAAILGGAFAFTRVLAACAADADETSAVAEGDLVDRTYDIKGASSHPHSVTITAANFDRLAAAGMITVVSTRDAGHTHNVTVTCAAADAGAGTDASSSDASAACTPSASSISANHGHALAIPAADVARGEPKTYSIKGTASHPHDIALTAEHFAALKAGRTITVTSTSVGSHTHDVTVVCA